MARIWDALFNEGPKILFRVALALLKLEEEALLRCDNAGEEGVGKGRALGEGVVIGAGAVEAGGGGIALVRQCG